MYRPKPVWQEWPYRERKERQRTAVPRKRVKGGRWFVMKAPWYFELTDSRHLGRPWKAFNLQKRRLARWFPTWQEAWDYALKQANRAYLDSELKRR